MSFGFDPSIIMALAAKPPAEPSLNDTLQTLSTLASQRTQRQYGQAQLADLLRQQQQQAQLADIYRATADASPADRVTALMRAGFGPQAREEQDQASQMQTAEATRAKMHGEIQAAERKTVGDHFFGTKDEADWKARLARLPQVLPGPSGELYQHLLSQQPYDPSTAEYLGNLSMTAKDRAELADKAAGRTQADKRIDIEDRRATAAERRASAVEARLAAGGMGAGGGLPNGITQGALEKQVDTYERTGALPQLGQGKAGAALRVAIMNRHAEKYPDSDLAGAKAGYTADSKSLAQQQKQADFMEGYENTGKKNLDTFLETAKKVADLGSPFFNARARQFSEKVAGSPEMAAFETSRQTAVQEIGKVLSGATGSGALSDSQRDEVARLLPADASWSQIQAAAKVLKKDMANRKEAVDEQLKATRGRISGKSAETKGGGLSKAEQDELKQLEARFGSAK